jgi:chromosome segregation ATPase
MGLFNRRDRTKEELDALRLELVTMRERLEESEGAKQRLAEHLQRVEAGQQQLTSQVGDVQNKVGQVETRVVTVAGSVDEAIVNAASATDVEAVRAEIQQLGALASRIDDLSNSLSTKKTTLPPPDSAPVHDIVAVLQQQVDELSEALARQREHIADIAIVATDTAERTDTALSDMRASIETGAGTHELDAETRRQLGQLAEKVGVIDSRVNQVSLELTNQLTELSNDIDRAGDRSNDETGADVTEAIDELVERLDELTSGQERLAGEQARYAIAFRNDLAELADRLRRPGAS